MSDPVYALSPEAKDRALKEAIAEKIPCQACQPRKDGERKGCYQCGGYGYMVEQFAIGCCGRLVWTRPGCHTIYVGKTWTTFDGVGIEQTKDGPKCARCMLAYGLVSTTA